MSVKNSDEKLTTQFIEFILSDKMINWILKLVSKYKNQERGVHTFTLDYSSALFANIMQSPRTTEILMKDQDQSFEIMT